VVRVAKAIEGMTSADVAWFLALPKALMTSFVIQ
jgi:hypothetical protein